MMDENSQSSELKTRATSPWKHGRQRLRSAELAEEFGLPHHYIILSAKVSGVQDLIDVYRSLAAAVTIPAPRPD